MRGIMRSWKRKLKKVDCFHTHDYNIVTELNYVLQKSTISLDKQSPESLSSLGSSSKVRH